MKSSNPLVITAGSSHGGRFLLAALRRADFAALVFAAAVLWMGLGSYGLVEPSDARYGEVAREMFVSGDYLFPRLAGIFHFHKPPLIYWLICGGYKIFGISEWGARAALGALGFIMILVVWRFARRYLDPGTAPLAVVVLATSPAVVVAGRMLTTDLLLATLQTITLTTWYGLWCGRGGRGSLLVLYTAAGLCFLAKGPVGWLVPGIVITLFIFLNRGQSGRQDSWGLAWGIPLVAAISLPWYLYVVAKTPGLLHYFIGDQLTSRVGGSTGHVRVWYYYLLVFPALGLPWILPAIAGARSAWRKSDPVTRFLLIWCLAPPVFFSFPATKLPLYVLLSYTPIALLAAKGLLEGGKLSRYSMISIAAVISLAGAAFLAVGANLIPLELSDLSEMSLADRRYLFLPISAVFFLGSGMTFMWGRRSPSRGALGVAASLAFLVMWSFANGEILPFQTAREMGLQARDELADSGGILVVYEDFSAGVPFYSGTMPLLVGIKRDLRFEDPAAPERVITDGAFRTLFTGPERVLVVTLHRYTRKLSESVVPTAGSHPEYSGPRELGRGGGYVLISNR
jgi:4-amino-4-deoxy-L-arabinose transferase